MEKRRTGAWRSPRWGPRAGANSPPARPPLFVYDRDPVAPGATGLPPEDWHEQLVRRLMLLVHNLSPEELLYEAAPAYALGDGQGRSACSLAGLTRHFAHGVRRTSGC